MRRAATAFSIPGPRALATTAAPSSLSDDMRLFALTYGAGFLFVSLFIA